MSFQQLLQLEPVAFGVALQFQFKGTTLCEVNSSFCALVHGAQSAFPSSLEITFFLLLLFD